MKQQKGFAHAFLIIGLVFAIVVALGFIYWQNFIHKEPTTETMQTTTTKSEITKSENSPAAKYVDLRKDAKDGTGLVLKSKADVASASVLSVELKTYFSKDVGTSVDFMGEPVVVAYTVDRVNGHYAVGGGGSAYNVWGPKDANGEVGVIAGIQNLGFKCADLKAAKVPSNLVDGKCYLFDGSATDPQVYSQQ